MTSLFWVSEETEKRRLTTVGSVLVASVLVVVTVLYFANSIDSQPRDYVSLKIDTPYVGEGVADGTPLIMHGVKVGHVSAVKNRPGGGVQIDALVRSSSANGLTDALGIDYRPSNYFGVTGINLLPKDGGQPLRSGAHLTITPDGNFALQALLYRLGGLTHDVINQRLIDVMERGTRFTNGLTPLLETMLIVAKAVADVQTVSTERLLRNTTGVSVGVPGFVDGLTRTVDTSLHSGLYDYKLAMGDPMYDHYLTTYDDQLKSQYESGLKLAQTNMDDFVYGPVKEFYDAASTDLFVKVGNILSTHTYDLFPVVEELRSITSVVPKIVNADGIGDTLRELHSRLTRMYEGSGEQRAMQVRIVLDEFPAIAAPLGLAVGAQDTVAGPVPAGVPGPAEAPGPPAEAPVPPNPPTADPAPAGPASVGGHG
jgi:hypothetical protein